MSPTYTSYLFGFFDKNPKFPKPRVFGTFSTVEESEETVLLVKSTTDKAAALRDFITKNHPYDIPAIVSLVVDEDTSNSQFMNWIKEQTSKDKITATEVTTDKLL